MDKLSVAREALDRLAKLPMSLSLSDWERISSTILAAIINPTALDDFMVPYAEAGHDALSVFRGPAYKCERCGAEQVDLSEDLAYGEMRKCTLAALAQPAPDVDDAARRIASYCEGEARSNVFKAGQQELSAVAALTPAPQPAEEAWQPIETAPKDGSVLGYCPAARGGNQVMTVRLRDGKPFVANGVFAFDLPAITHWCPLPAPPAAAIRGGAE